MAKQKVKRMEQRVIGVPSTSLSTTVLALGAAIGSSGSSHGSTPPSGIDSAILGKGVGLGLGLNLSTLAWHAFSLLLPHARDGPDPSYRDL